MIVISNTTNTSAEIYNLFNQHNKNSYDKYYYVITRGFFNFDTRCNLLMNIFPHKISENLYLVDYLVSNRKGFLEDLINNTYRKGIILIA